MSLSALGTSDVLTESVASVEQAAALTQRLLESVGPALELLTIELGHRLGLYAAIDTAGIVTAPDLSRPVLRGPTVVASSARAGFRRATRLAIDHPTRSFYRLDP
ncbi:hypothetical protein [Microbacterium hibisci]|uniref:hypothetical protein n=1 Tax=Microbacterium hibisci TaxID=2036000 RepID=UPI001941F71A|nr:hypothetical protein [Microbacterium hibisci]